MSGEGDACLVCGREFVNGDTMIRTDVPWRNGWRYEHVACQAGRNYDAIIGAATKSAKIKDGLTYADELAELERLAQHVATLPRGVGAAGRLLDVATRLRTGHTSATPDPQTRSDAGE